MFNIENLGAVFEEIYGSDPLMRENQTHRYEKLVREFHELFETNEIQLFSAPGRTEIGGNHTDHNLGRVLAASVNLDSIAVAGRNQTKWVEMYSEGYDEPFSVDLGNLNVVESEKGTTSALIRGIAARLKQQGYKIGGFHACVTSDVLPGSGLSSSASIEVLIGTIFNALFNENRIDPQAIAIIGQYAENNYFGKPCGLMDQMACAVGGVLAIDFNDPQHPQVKKVDFDFSAQDYRLLVVNTGGSHADLTDDYAAVPEEMKSVARILGAKVCREIEWKDLLGKISAVREKTGDRAVLRAIHFLGDNSRVLDQVDALEKGEFNRFLHLVNESGNSSFKWLQNIYSSKNVHEQGVSLALALTEKYLSEIHAGACRVHGGGFAGTIQVFLPVNAVDEYVRMIESVFGKDSAQVLNIRPVGAVCFNPWNSHAG